MEEDLRALLRGSAAIAAIVGTRVDWSVRPQGAALPAICLTRIAGSPGFTMSGPDSAGPVIVQIECWATTYSAAKLLARAVRAAINGLKNADFLGIFIEDERDDFDPGVTPYLFRTALDARIWAPEPA